MSTRILRRATLAVAAAAAFGGLTATSAPAAVTTSLSRGTLIVVSDSVGDEIRLRAIAEANRIEVLAARRQGNRLLVARADVRSSALSEP